MCLSVQKLTFSQRWCLVHRRLSVYPGACADTYSSLASISLGLICLHFCSSSLFPLYFFFPPLSPQKSSLSFLSCSRGMLLASSEHFVPAWSHGPFCPPASMGTSTSQFSALPHTVWLLSWTEGLTLLCRAEHFETWTPASRRQWSDSSTQHQNTFDKNLLLNQHCSLM